MNLLESIVDNAPRGQCETNHFHIVINNELEENRDFWEQKQDVLGIFMHEYLHYIQHFITLRGLSTVAAYNNYFLKCFQCFIDNETIDIPLSILKKHTILENFNNDFKRIKGSKSNLDIEFSEVEILEENILKAKRQKKPVQVDVYDYKSDQAEIFDFGYYCIIESMAHLFQSLYDPQIKHSNIPYNTVQLVCKSVYPEVADDKRMMISLCLCSLIDMNPGAYFFDIISYAKENRTLNGLQLYELILRTEIIKYQGKRVHIKNVLLTFLQSLESDLKKLTANSLDAYSPIIENCKYEVSKDSSILLEILYNGDITSPDAVKTLLSIYGYPYIEAKNVEYVYTFKDESGEIRPAKDIAMLRGIELIMKRLCPPKDYQTGTFDHKCPLFSKCNSFFYDEKIEEEYRPPMDENCLSKQWLKRGSNCLLGEAFHFYHLSSKKYKIFP